MLPPKEQDKDVNTKSDNGLIDTMPHNAHHYLQQRLKMVTIVEVNTIKCQCCILNIQVFPTADQSCEHDEVT